MFAFICKCVKYITQWSPRGFENQVSFYLQGCLGTFLFARLYRDVYSSSSWHKAATALRVRFVLQYVDTSLVLNVRIQMRITKEIHHLVNPRSLTIKYILVKLNQQANSNEAPHLSSHFYSLCLSFTADAKVKFTVWLFSFRTWYQIILLIRSISIANSFVSLFQILGTQSHPHCIP